MSKSLAAFALVLLLTGVVWAQSNYKNTATDISWAAITGTIPAARLGSGTANNTTFLRGDQTWAVPPAGNGGLPSGAIVLSLAACPTGFTEEQSLSGKFVLGTLDGAGNVGTTGGSDDITAVLNHTHAVNVTDPQHNHTQNAHTHVVTSQTATTGAATSYEHGTLDTSSAEAEATEVTGSTTATNNAAATGITASTANPAGGVASIDNRPAFVRVIFCRAL